MIPTDHQFQFGHFYRHERTGKLYQLLCQPDYTCQMKVADGKWTPAIIYQPVLESRGVFVRDTEHFRKNFTYEGGPGMTLEDSSK